MATPANSSVTLTFDDVIGSSQYIVYGSPTVDYDTLTASGPVEVEYQGQKTPATFDFLTYDATHNEYHLGYTTSTGGGVQALEFTYIGKEPTSFRTITYDNGQQTAVRNNGAVESNPCYVTGTLIATARGEVPVESLAVGDLVTTASGASRPIKWIGHRTVDFARHPRPESARPYRISASAFGEGLPQRDLVVSPDHCILVKAPEELLVPAKCLENGATVVQLDVNAVTYWHVELDSHDLLLAEGLAAESYMDTGNRSAFENADSVTMLHADFSPGGTEDYCRPFVDAGEKLCIVRAQLHDRAETMGWTMRQSEGNLHLVADGIVVQPQVNGSWSQFTIPASAREVRLVSDRFVPIHGSAERADRRDLGVMIREMVLDEAKGRRHAVALDHEALGRGFHILQGEGKDQFRWTDGNAALSSALWADLDGPITLYVKYGTLRGGVWQAPALGEQVPGMASAA